jgi:F1F0 ATPase subunit 2
MTNEILVYIVSLIIGGTLGAFYFGGLWLTVSRVTSNRHPVLLNIGSFFIRTIITLTGFYFVVRGGYWKRLIVCLIGFVIVKFLLVRKFKIRNPIKEKP